MKWVIVVGFIMLLVIGFFLVTSGDITQDLDEEKISIAESERGESSSDSSVILDSIWRTTELIDIRTGETFTINQFDKPILLESFAVWCPTCTKQQWEISDLHKEVGDAVISISLNTDPNEDKEKVLTHINSNNFNWYYAIAPKELTQSLIDEFGVTVVNAPSAPVILIDENKNAKLLHNGVKSSSELKGELRL